MQQQYNNKYNNKLILLLTILFIIPITKADSLNATYLYNFTKATNPCSLDGSQQAIFQQNLMYFTSSPDDSLGILNISNKTNFICVGNYTSSTNLDGAMYMTLDNSTNLIYVSSGGALDMLTVLNVTNMSTIIYVWNYTKGASPYSSDGVRGTQLIKKGDSIGLAIAGTSDSELSVINVTALFNGGNTTTGIFTNASSTNSITNLISFLGYDENRSILYSVSQGGGAIAAWNVSTTMNLTFLSSYTDTASPCSLEAGQSGEFDFTRQLYYGVSRNDGDLTIINLSNPTNLSCAGSITAGQGALFIRADVEYTPIGDFAFMGIDGNIGDNTAFVASVIVNITNPLIPTLYMNFTNTSNGGCVYNRSVFNYAEGRYLYVNQAGNGLASTAGCLSVFTLYNITAQDTCTYTGSGDWNINCLNGCNITTNTTLINGNITFSGAGRISLSSIINGWKTFTIGNQCRLDMTIGQSKLG